MTPKTLIDEYETLRVELDDAYSEPAWDSGRIDRIAEQLASLEHTMAALQVRAPTHDAEA